MPKVSRTKKSRVHHPAVPAPGAKRTDMRFAGLADTSSHDQAEGKEAATTKRDKREERREGWLNKLNVHYAVKYRADLKRKKVEKEGVAADLDSLKFALLEEELKGGEQDGEGDAGEEMEKEEGNEPSAVDNLKPVEKKPVSQRARIKGNIAEIMRLQKVINHKSFRADPLKTIQTHTNLAEIDEQRIYGWTSPRQSHLLSHRQSAIIATPSPRLERDATGLFLLARLEAKRPPYAVKMRSLKPSFLLASLLLLPAALATPPAAKHFSGPGQPCSAHLPCASSLTCKPCSTDFGTHHCEDAHSKPGAHGIARLGEVCEPPGVHGAPACGAGLVCSRKTKGGCGVCVLKDGGMDHDAKCGDSCGGKVACGKGLFCHYAEKGAKKGVCVDGKEVATSKHAPASHAPTSKHVAPMGHAPTPKPNPVHTTHPSQPHNKPGPVQPKPKASSSKHAPVHTPAGGHAPNPVHPPIHTVSSHAAHQPTNKGPATKPKPTTPPSMHATQPGGHGKFTPRPKKATTAAAHPKPSHSSAAHQASTSAYVYSVPHLGHGPVVHPKPASTPSHHSSTTAHGAKGSSSPPHPATTKGPSKPNGGHSTVHPKPASTHVPNPGRPHPKPHATSTAHGSLVHKPTTIKHTGKPTTNGHGHGSTVVHTPAHGHNERHGHTSVNHSPRTTKHAAKPTTKAPGHGSTPSHTTAHMKPSASHGSADHSHGYVDPKPHSTTANGHAQPHTTVKHSKPTSKHPVKPTAHAHGHFDPHHTTVVRPKPTSKHPVKPTTHAHGHVDPHHSTVVHPKPTSKHPVKPTTHAHRHLDPHGAHTTAVNSKPTSKHTGKPMTHAHEHPDPHGAHSTGVHPKPTKTKGHPKSEPTHSGSHFSEHWTLGSDHGGHDEHGDKKNHGAAGEHATSTKHMPAPTQAGLEKHDGSTTAPHSESAPHLPAVVHKSGKPHHSTSSAAHSHGTHASGVASATKKKGYHFEKTSAKSTETSTRGQKPSATHHGKGDDGGAHHHHGQSTDGKSKTATATGHDKHHTQGHDGGHQHTGGAHLSKTRHSHKTQASSTGGHSGTVTTALSSVKGGRTHEPHHGGVSKSRTGHAHDSTTSAGPTTAATPAAATDVAPGAGSPSAPSANGPVADPPMAYGILDTPAAVIEPDHPPAAPSVTATHAPSGSEGDECGGDQETPCQHGLSCVKGKCETRARPGKVKRKTTFPGYKTRSGKRVFHAHKNRNGA